MYNRGTVTIQRTTKSRIKPSEDWYNMKNSAPSNSGSLQKPPNTRDQTGFVRSSQKNPSKNTFAYDFSNTPLKNLLKDKNIPQSNYDQKKPIKMVPISDFEAKKDFNKKQFRIRQNGGKDNNCSTNVRPLSKETDENFCQKTEVEQKSRIYPFIKREEEVRAQKQFTKRQEEKPKLKERQHDKEQNKEEGLDKLKLIQNKSNIVLQRGSSRLQIRDKKNMESSNSTATGESPEKKLSTLYSKAWSKTAKLVGLNNIGNTCFMNSILQCMFNLPYFNEYFLQDFHKAEIKSGGRVAEAYARMIKTMRNSNRDSETPSELKSQIGAKRSRFMGYSQQDSQEFLAALLELLSSDLNRARNPQYKQLTADTSKSSLSEISNQWWQYNRQREDSVICDFFSGQILSKVVCSRCKNESIAFDNIWDMALNFNRDDDGKILKMIQNFIKQENISSDYYCSKCQSFRECNRKIDFYRLPNILVLQLKRFSFGSWRKSKLNNNVKVQLSLDLSSIVDKSRHSSMRNPIYDLVGVVNHSGGIDFGHYTAQCKNSINGKWYNFNDESVSETRMKDGCESSSPYVLFYAKRDM